MKEEELEFVENYKNGLNEMNIETSRVPNGVRSDKRTKIIGEIYKNTLLSSHIVDLEKIVYISDGTKKIDMIVDNKWAINCVYPRQSISKNIPNYFNHIREDSNCEFIENGEKIKNFIGIICVPTFTYNKLKGVFKPQNVKEKYLNRKCKEGIYRNKENPYFEKKEHYDSDGDKITYLKYVIFFEPYDNYLNIIKGNNSTPDGKYIKEIFNPKELINLYKVLNNL